MKKTAIVILLLGIAIGAYADDVKIPNDGGEPAERVECDVTGCTQYVFPVGQVLVSDVLYTFGPLPTAPGGVITKIIGSLTLTQTWVGDLVAWLYYDVDGDNVYDIGPVALLCRPNLAGCPWPDGCCGCSGDVNGYYTFGDEALAALGDPTCPSLIPTGCYLPAPESPFPFAAFIGAPTGGNFWLEIGDAAAGDDTNLTSWDVWVCAEVTGTEESSWGQVKTLYR
jgi:hypothetical protein